MQSHYNQNYTQMLQGSIRTDNIQLMPKRSDLGSESNYKLPVFGNQTQLAGLSKPPTHNNKTQVHKRINFSDAGNGEDRGLIDRTQGHEIKTPSSHNFNAATEGGSFFNQSQHYGSFVGSKNTFKTDHEGVYVDKQALTKKIERTPYMKEYQKNIKFETMKAFDPEQLDETYNDKRRLLYAKTHSKLPEQLEQYFDMRHSVIQFSDQQMSDLRDAFEKFDEQNTGVMEPAKLKEEFEKRGYHLSNPPLFSMISWIVDASSFAGQEKIDFDQFLEFAMFFFSQKQQDEGLRYIFQLFDTNCEGRIDKIQFDRACVHCGITLKQHQIDEVFRKASNDGKYIKFSEFVFFMQKTD